MNHCLSFSSIGDELRGRSNFLCLQRACDLKVYIIHVCNLLIPEYRGAIIVIFLVLYDIWLLDQQHVELHVQIIIIIIIIGKLKIR